LKNHPAQKDSQDGIDDVTDDSPHAGKGKGKRDKGEGVKAEGGRQKAEGRRQKAKGKRQSCCVRGCPSVKCSIFSLRAFASLRLCVKFPLRETFLTPSRKVAKKNRKVEHHTLSEGGSFPTEICGHFDVSSIEGFGTKKRIMKALLSAIVIALSSLSFVVGIRAQSGSG